MYLIKMLKDQRVATLSRGYGRKTSGLIVAGPKENPTSLGDEPFQFLSVILRRLWQSLKKELLG